MSEETFGNWIKIMNKTLNYYNENAQSFASGTVSVEFTEMQDKFLQKLNPGAYILDFGCGAGRDTKYFLDQGYLVEAIDGSEQLCQIASKHTGIKVRQMLFQELKVNEKYDGIWACASILPMIAAYFYANYIGGKIKRGFQENAHSVETWWTDLYFFQIWRV